MQNHRNRYTSIPFFKFSIHAHKILFLLYILSLLYHAPLNFTLNSNCHGTLTALRILKLLLVREHKWEHPHKNSLPSFSRVYDSYIRLADLCFLNIADILSTTMSLTSIVPVSEVRLNTLYECLPLEPQRSETKGKSGGWTISWNLIHNNIERSINSFNRGMENSFDSFHIKLLQLLLRFDFLLINLFIIKKIEMEFRAKFKFN